MKAKRRKFPPSVYAAIIAKQKGKCWCCGEELGTDPRAIHYDHGIPLWLGGADHPDNLRALKIKHHLEKTSKEAGQRAKIARVVEQGGLLKPKMSAQQKALQRYLTPAIGKEPG